MGAKSHDFYKLRKTLGELKECNIVLTDSGKIFKSGVVKDVVFKDFNIKIMLLEQDGVIRAFDCLFPFEYEVAPEYILLNYHFEKINTLTNTETIVEFAQLQEQPHKLYQNELRIEIKGKP